MNDVKQFWDPSQMITCHLKKIPKLLLTGGVVQFRHDVNQFFPQSGSYGVFTAVSSFRSWIDRTLSKYGGEELVCSWICFYLKSSFCRGALYKECKGWTCFGLYKDSLLLLRSLVKDCSELSELSVNKRLRVNLHTDCKTTEWNNKQIIKLRTKCKITHQLSRPNELASVKLRPQCKITSILI